MNPLVALFIVAAIGITSSIAQAETLALANPGFESGLTGWNTKGDNQMSAVNTTAAHSGTLGLKIIDNDTKQGASVATDHFPAKKGEVFEVRFWAKTVSGSGGQVYLQFLDEAHRKLTDVIGDSGDRSNMISIKISASDNDWKQYVLQGVAPEGAAQVYIWIHTSSKGIAEVDFDDFEFSKL